MVGGGLAGLHTAWRLQQQGHSCLLLEARHLPGGRIAAAGGRLAGTDLGPTWFWPHHPMMTALLEEMDLRWFTQHSDGDVLFQPGQGQPPLRRRGAGTPVSYRVAGGMQALIRALQDRLTPDSLLLGHAVKSARRRGNVWHLDVTGSGTSFESGSLVAALPPRMLVRDLGAAQWASPGLLEALNLQQTWMSAQAKFVAGYSSPFWRESGLSGDAFSRVGPMLEIHDAADESTGTFALFGFIGVPAVMRLDIEPGELQAACIRQLVQLFGEDAAEPVECALKDWARDDFTVTAADIEELPAHAEFPLDAFSEELESLRLLAAGSEFAAGNPGYLEGALEASTHCVDQLTGARAARRFD